MVQTKITLFTQQKPAQDKSGAAVRDEAPGKAQNDAATGQRQQDVESHQEHVEGNQHKSDVATEPSEEKRDQKLVMCEESGDLFDAPEDAVLIHACNCQGSWGAGIAATFKKKYPRAYTIHREFCSRGATSALRGTTQLIPPVEKSGKRHYVACLFTSGGYGRRKDPVAQILRNTKTAVYDLLTQVAALQKAQDGKVGDLYMCRINGGLFAVPWERTKALLESMEIEGGMPTKVTVISPL